MDGGRHPFRIIEVIATILMTVSAGGLALAQSEQGKAVITKTDSVK
jgi:hypothetical protein